MIKWDSIHERAREEQVSPHLIFKESLHLLVLDHLFRQGSFEFLVFQGGTALRFAYEGIRYSEDLDFVVKKTSRDFFEKASAGLGSLAAHLKRTGAGLEDAQLKRQKETETFKRFTLIVRAQELAAGDKTHIEIARVPSYDHRVTLLRRPGSLLNPAVCVETPAEILGDKLCAFGSRKFVKGRDLWDLYDLVCLRKMEPGSDARELVARKIADYGMTKEVFGEGVQRNMRELERNGKTILSAEMDRFLPEAYRMVYAPRYGEILEAVRQVLKTFFKEKPQA